MAVARLRAEQIQARARWRFRSLTLTLCLLLDCAVVGLYLAFRNVEAPSIGWAVTLVVPVVLAAAHQSKLVRFLQVIATLAVLTLVMLMANGSAAAVALDGSMVGGSLLASAWVTDRLFRQVRDHLADLRTAANTDRLTGLLNRRGLHAAYADVAAEAAASGQPIAVITADLDSMKKINDTHGHKVGDQVLQQLTDRLTRAAPGALVARIGGDEYVIVVAGSSDPIVNHLQLLLQSEPILPATGVSFGTATGTADPKLETLWTLIDRADQVLYRAKRRTKGDRTRVGTYRSATRIAQRPHQTIAPTAARVDRLLPTREQRQLYAVVIIWDALVGTAGAVLQSLDRSGSRGPNLWVLMIGVSVAAILVWRILRPGAAQSFFTGVLVAAAAVLTLIALTTQNQGTSDAGVVLWGPLLLLAARYWPRLGMIGIYGWLIIMATTSHLLHTGIGTAPSVKLLLQVISLIVAAEVVYHVRRRDETLVERLTAQALTDLLTGLSNRRGLEAAVQQLVPGSVTALMIDIDGFKQINDEFGHHQGDQTLMSVAQILSSLSPAGSVQARLGGDEFLILGSQLDPNDLMGALQEAAAALPNPVSLSSGTANAMLDRDNLDNENDSLWQLINVADQDLLATRTKNSASR